MADERPRLTASEIEEELLAELQKLPTLRGTKSVRIRPYNRKWGLRRSSLSTWRPSSLDCNNNTTSISALRRLPEDDVAAKRTPKPTKPDGRKQCGASWCTW
jgi:hypothetical protein